MVSTEHIICSMPLVVRRRVKWGECDPAGVVYTVVFAEYVISAAEIFYEFVFGTTPQAATGEFGFKTPTRALTFDFRRSLCPGEDFDMTVLVSQIRSRSYGLQITARTPSGGVVFVAVLTPVCIGRKERRAIELPASFRSPLEKYQAACRACAEATPSSATPIQGVSL